MNLNCPHSQVCNISNLGIDYFLINKIKYLFIYVNFRWIQACINEELPPTTELEEGLRNGVYLAKLGHFLAPKIVTVKKIYDKEQTRYEVRHEFDFHA